MCSRVALLFPAALLAPPIARAAFGALSLHSTSAGAPVPADPGPSTQEVAPM
jgi:hypothetical protein